MRRILPIIAVLVSFVCEAQEDAGRTSAPAPKRFVTTIPVRCILRDYTIGYGHAISPRHTIEYRLGWVHRNNFLHQYYESWLNSTDMRFRGPSFYVQVNKWKFNKNGRRIFAGLIAGYRYLYYQDEKMHIYDGDGRSDDRDIVLSQWRNDFYVLLSFGFVTSKFTSTELSIGARFMFTYSRVSAIQNPRYDYTQDHFNAVANNSLEMIPHSAGFGVVPVMRLSSRLGWFQR